MSGSATPGRPRWWVWVWPVVLTVVLTGTGIGRAELWRDELVTWSAATRPVPRLVGLVGTIDAGSGPYYLLVHGWIAVFGDSATALRLPSALAMSAAAGLTARIGARLGGDRAGLVAGLLFAVLPVTSRYGQEARSYALATLLAVVATGLLLRALAAPGRWRWTAYATALVGLGLAHLLALALVAGHAVGVVAATRGGRRRLLVGWLVAVGVAGLALTPLVLLAAGQRGRQLGWVGLASLTNLPSLPGAVLGSAAVGGAVAVLVVVGATVPAPAGATVPAADSATVPAPAGATVPAADSATVPAPAGATVLAADSAAGRWRTGLLLPVASALVPAALLFLAGLAVPLFVPRYLTFVVPLLCLPAATALAAVRLVPALVAVLLVAVLGAPDQVALRRTHEWPRSAPRDYSAAIRIIAGQQRPGDGIVYPNRTGWWFTDTAVAYHLGAAAPRDVLVSRSAVDRDSLWPTECAQPARCLAGTDRLWLLGTTTNDPDPLHGLSPGTAEAVRAEFTVARVWTVPGLTVTLLTR